MVTVNPKLPSAAALQAQAMQRAMVLQATRAGMETLMKTGEAERPAPAPATPPQPERPAPQIVARAVTNGGAVAQHLPADVASAYAQAGGEVPSAAAALGQVAGRAGADGPRDNPVPQPRGDAGQLAGNATVGAFGLVGHAGTSRQASIAEDGERRARGWSLKWWGPAGGENRPATIVLPMKHRLMIAAALIAAGIAVAAML